MHVQMEQRIKRVREKLELQVREVERSEQGALSRYNETRQLLSEATTELTAARGALQQREKELEEVRAVAARLTRERDNVTEVVRLEFTEKLATSERDVEQLRKALSEERTTHRAEVAEVMASKDRELDAIHARVRGAIQLKDDTIATLRSQFEAAAVRADHLEQV